MNPIENVGSNRPDHQAKIISVLGSLQRCWDSAFEAYNFHPTAKFRSEQDALDISLWMACCAFLEASEIMIDKALAEEIGDWLMKCGCNLLDAAECCVYIIDRQFLFDEIGRAIEAEPAVDPAIDTKDLTDEFYDIFQPHDTEKE